MEEQYVSDVEATRAGVFGVGFIVGVGFTCSRSDKPQLSTLSCRIKKS
jgi:hypothetical protein